jgi:2-succinyl-6-hydroxy-2,4-cyclohexadiene-1-carboxylate synthase
MADDMQTSDEHASVVGHDQAQYPLRPLPSPTGPALGVPLQPGQVQPGQLKPGQLKPGQLKPGQLSARYAGHASGPGLTPLVLLHGFTQTGASWGPVLEALDGHFPIILPDAPGHGGSSAVRADLWQTADLLAGLTSSSGTAPGLAAWAGYSMGGRTALHFAIAHPEQMASLVLISTSAGIDEAAKRAERQTSDEALARRIEREGTEEFLDWWLAQPLFATLAHDDAGLADRLTNTPAGLASSLRLAGAGAQQPLWDRLGEIGERGLPVLLLAGELDHDYTRHAERMAALIGPTAHVEVVRGAGHACYLERPAQVAMAISRFCQLAPGPVPDGPVALESQPDGEQDA